MRWIIVLRELFGNRARTALVVLSIAVGVFAIGTIINSWIIMLKDLNYAYAASQPANVVMSIEAFDNDLVAAVNGMREIEQAEGRTAATVKLNTLDGEQLNLTLYAVEDFRTLSLNQITPESALWPPQRRQIFIERSWASELEGLTEGSTVRVETPDGRSYDLVFNGLAHDLHQPSAFISDMAYGYVTLDTLRWMGLPDQYNRLYLTVAENADDKDHIASVASLVKERLQQDGYTVNNTTIPTPGEHFASPFVKAFLLVLGIIGMFALLLSGALVLNTVSAVIARQVKQIGIMKAIGGENIRIVEIYIATVLSFGLLSLLIAVPLGRLGTFGLSDYFAQQINFDVVTRSMPPVVLAVQLVVALGVPIVAAMIPVLSGVQITVREAISSYGLGSGTDSALLVRLGKLLGGLSSSFALALGNTFRRKMRLALTLITLTLAGAIFVAVLSVQSSLDGTFQRVLGYVQYDIATDFAQPYRTAQIEREARRDSAVTDVEGWLTSRAIRVRPGGAESANYQIIGVPPQSDFLNPTVIEGRWLQPGDQNAAVVNVDFTAEEPDVQVGDSITLAAGDKEMTWVVVGVITTQFSQPAYIYTSDEALGRALGLVGYANRAVIRLTNSTPDFQRQTAPQVEEQFKNSGLQVASTQASSDFIASFEARFNILIFFMIFMALLLAIVGGLGLAGTMGLNVLERIREIGVMRAIGASNGDVQRIVIAEGLVTGVLSWLIASIIALPLSKVMSDGVGIAFARRPLEFNFSLTGTALWLVMVLAIAAISTYIPARNASRITVREVLAYE